LSIIQGYDQVVGLDGLETFKWRGLLVAALALAAAMLRALTSVNPEDAAGARNFVWRKAVFLLWMVLFLFMVWKHGFVRADLYHMGFCFGFVPVFVWALEVIPCATVSSRLWGRGLAVVTSLVALATVESLFFASLKSSLIQPFSGFRENLAAL